MNKEQELTSNGNVDYLILRMNNVSKNKMLMSYLML